MKRRTQRLGADEQGVRKTATRPYVRFAPDQMPWLNNLSTQFGLEVPWMVALVASGEIQLPWDRLGPPPPEPSRLPLSSNVKLPDDESLRVSIRANATASGLAFAVFVRRAVLDDEFEVPASADAVLLLPTCDELALQKLFRLIDLLWPNDPGDWLEFPEPLRLRRHVERRGFGFWPQRVREKILELERRTLAARRLGGRGAQKAQEALRMLVIDIGYYGSMH